MAVQDESSVTKSSLEITVAGAALDPSVKELCELIRVKDEWMLPSAAMLRFFQPQGTRFEWQLLDVGKPLTLALGAIEANTTTPTFDGEIVAVEPDFLPDGTTWTFRALDRGHRLMRGTRTRTYTHMTAGDVAMKIADESGLTAVVDLDTTSHEYLLQAGESDWTYLWRHALALGGTVRVRGTQLQLRRAATSEDGPTLSYPGRLRAFRPRRSIVSQVDEVSVLAWDAKGKQPIVARAASASPDVPVAGGDAKPFPGAARTASEAVDDQDGADRRAQAILDALTAGRTEAEGVTAGDPAIRAGTIVTVEGLVEGWNGRYQLTSVEHVHRATGFETHFTIGGHAPRTLLDIVRRPGGAAPEPSAQLLIGIVTNNKDPEQLGRVKVRFPTLGQTTQGMDVESQWARLATLNAGRERGVLMVPQVDDEVVVAFESGDLRRPVVLGSLFNGKDRPHADHVHGGDAPDGSFVVRGDALLIVETREDQTFTSREGAVAVQSKGDNTTRTQGDVATEAQGNVTTSAQGNIEATALGNLTEEASGNARLAATGTTTVSGTGGVTVESAGSMTLRAAGVLTIQGSQVNITGGLINLG